MLASLLVVYAFALVAAVGGWVYFRRVRVNRPPIGVVNLRDAFILIAILAVMPYLYLSLPLVVISALLVIVVLTALHMALEPVLTHRALLWGACLGLIAADITLAVTGGVTNAPFLLVNNAILAAVVIGAANLWAQSGMKAREVAILSGVLAVYDVIATWQLTVMTDVFERLSQLPLVPVVAWGLSDPDTSLRLGLGDLLLLTVVPIVFRKAFGRRAGLVALISGLSLFARAARPPDHGSRDGLHPGHVASRSARHRPVLVLAAPSWRGADHSRVPAGRAGSQSNANNRNGGGEHHAQVTTAIRTLRAVGPVRSRLCRLQVDVMRC